MGEEGRGWEEDEQNWEKGIMKGGREIFLKRLPIG